MTEIIRCPWGMSEDPLEQNYHDYEWGKLNLDDRYLYEMLVLELFQAGLSWSTILHKRKNFRRAFKNFDPAAVAQMNEAEITQLMQDKSIIRNQQKIRATIQNARALLVIEASYGSFGQYLQEFIKEPIINHPQTSSEVPATNDIAKSLAKQLKHDGFAFVGPVIIYSFLQAVGLINDHLQSCSFKY